MIELLLPVIGKLIDRVIPDKAAAAKAKADLESAEMQSDLQLLVGQMEVNKVEAAHENLFVAGWRPFIGWICGVSLAAIVGVALYQWVDLDVQPDLSFVISILLGMLGLGGFRTIEKIKGVAGGR